MKEDLISIIVPIYNVARYLRKCLDSIINQSYERLEIILVDDGSSDDSPSICDYYKKRDSRIIVIHKTHGGLSSARNTGLSRCHGKYISFVDSDDHISSTMIEDLYHALIINDAQMSICSFSFENGLTDRSYDKTNPIVDDVISGSSLLKELFFSPYQIYWSVVWNKLYFRGLFDSIMFPEGYYYEDLQVVPLLIKDCEKIACISQPLYYYVQHEGSILHSVNDRNIDRALAYMKLADCFASNKDYSSLMNGLLLRGLNDYKTEYWDGDIIIRNPGYGKERKKEIQSLFGSAWKKYKHTARIGLKQFIYFELHYRCLGLVKAFHLTFRKNK